MGKKESKQSLLKQKTDVLEMLGKGLDETADNFFQQYKYYATQSLIFMGVGCAILLNDSFSEILHFYLRCVLKGSIISFALAYLLALYNLSNCHVAKLSIITSRIVTEKERMVDSIKYVERLKPTLLVMTGFYSLGIALGVIVLFVMVIFV